MRGRDGEREIWGERERERERERGIKGFGVEHLLAFPRSFVLTVF